MRGDVYRLRRLADTQGHEQRGERFAVVLQADHLSALSTLIVAPTSSSAGPADYRPEIEVGGKATRVLVEQMRAVDPTRLGEFFGRLDGHEMDAVNRAVRDVLALLG